MQAFVCCLRLLAGLLFALPTIPAHALVIDSDAAFMYTEAEFYSRYGSPTVLNDFSHLKDGSSLAGLDYFSAGLLVGSNPLFTGVSFPDPNGSFEVVVREEAWSDRYNIRQPNGFGGFLLSTLWDGGSVAVVGALSIHGAPNLVGSPFAIYLVQDLTYGQPIAPHGGFIGVVPDQIHDNHFLVPIPAGWRIDEIRLGMQAVASVAEPSPLAMLCMSLGLLGLVRGRRT